MSLIGIHFNQTKRKQAGAELCQAQAQQGYHAEATTSKLWIKKVETYFALYGTATEQVTIISSY